MEMPVTMQHSRDDVSLDYYLQEIGETDLLTPEEEVTLAGQIKDGDEGAVDRLVKANLRFVVSVAKQYQNRGMSLSDLISEGNIGLMKAARRFDAARGFKFISYAVWWIRQSILSAMNEQGRLIRLPGNKVGELHKIRKHNREREMQLGNDELSDDDIAGPQRAPEWAATPLSLDAPMGGFDDYSLMDRLEDENSASPDEVWMEDAMKQEIGRAVASLTEREGEILSFYFGLNTDRAHTLEEIGKTYGITRERVRQIKQKAINKLRHTSRSKRLAAYAD